MTQNDTVGRPRIAVLGAGLAAWVCQKNGSGSLSVVTVGGLAGCGALCEGDAGAMLINF